MKQRKVIIMLVAGLLSLFTQQMQAQSAKDLINQAKKELKGGSCNNAQKARKLLNQAKKIEPNFTENCKPVLKDCNDIINKECQESLVISEDVVEIPYEGKDAQIVVKASKGWNVIGQEDWLEIPLDKKDKTSFVIRCLKPNNNTQERTANLMVKSGTLSKTIKVIQEARPEYIEVDAKSLNFPPTGSAEPVKVESNADWDVSTVPSWCTVEKGDSAIRIIVSPNDRVMERTDDITIVSPNKSITIKISQGAGQEHLTLSQDNIMLPAEGGKHYMKVYTDAENWFVGDFPSWLNVQRIGNDSICIESRKFVAYSKAEENRAGSVQIKTDRQTKGVMVTQPALPIQYIVGGGTNLIPGRNISFGISAGYNMPFVNASAGGDYEGSVIDYSLGNSRENASYKKAIGYSIGVFADIRLGKRTNFFLMPGVNFTQIKYQNEFNLPTTYTMPHTSYQYLRGEVMNSYKEEYSHTIIEVPILASYRFKLNEISHVQLNLGPVLNIGITSKMKLTGNTDSETLHLYNVNTNKQANNANYLRHTSASADFNLYQSFVDWTESYTTGNVADVSHHDTFNDSPLHRFNMGLRVGAAYEIAGLSFGLYYTAMLTNMANKGYWENKRWTVLNESNQVMTGYKQRIHTLEFRLAYTMRYIGMSKKNK